MDIWNNMLAGMTQATLVTFVGYPFDIVKAKQQIDGNKNQTWGIIKNTLKYEGVAGFYRGSSMPLISHMIKRPIQYPISEYLKTTYATNDNSKLNTISKNYLIGIGCGFIGPIFGTPFQVIKVGMQTSGKKSYKNSIVYAKSIVEKHGAFSLYRGFIPTVIKDCVFGGSFLGTYYTFRDFIGTNTWYKNFFNGSMAHCITWFTFIPIDYIKTNIQKASNQRNSPTIKSVIVEGYHKGGLKIFWKGVIPACLRTIPVSGIAMIGYELVREHLNTNSSKGSP
jgi:solute carrier family 25 (mitochondrial carnitine/acylcarnitine transporter), member 20/29